ncbi:arabinosyltransferase domain-containing protein, partial [Tsukamurella sp. 8J]
LVQPTSPSASAARGVRVTAITAAVTGLLGLLFALLTPVMPVHQTTAALNWPQRGTLQSVTAPLVSFVPDRIEASVPCAAVDHLPHGVGVLVSTGPPESDDTLGRALLIQVSGTPDAPPDKRTLEVIVRNTPLVTATVAQVRQAGCDRITFTGSSDRVYGEITGIKDPRGGTYKGEKENGFDYRPQVVGVFSDLTGPVTSDTAIDFHARIDTRYTTTPTLLRWITIVLAVALIAMSLATLHRLDQATDGRRHRRIFPRHWFRPTKLDTTVLVTLAAWHMIGANTSDDGYILTMARTAGHAGYTANYYRWYGAPETPFGWYYEAFGLLAKISTASPWVRLPALACGIATWLIISREVVPRLGRAARSRYALWAAAGVFLVYWMAFNNGLRPEPVIALGALLTWCSVERAIATGRVLPFAVACIFAGWTLAAGPTGIMTVAALLAGVRPVGRRIIARARASDEGFRLTLLAYVAPVLAAGVLLVPIIFSKLTLAAFLAKSAMQQNIGTVVPTKHWFNEIDRYSALFTFTADGGIARRFAVLATLACLAIAGAVVLRRSHVPGASLGPGRRLIAVTFGGLLLLMFTPTKWTHQFGAFAGLAGALAALTAVALSRHAMRTPRNRALATAVVLFVLGLSFSGPNGWWYVANYGVPWGTSTVLGLGGVFFVLAGLAVLYAGWLHFHEDSPGPHLEPHAVGEKADGRLQRIGRFAASQSPITWASGLVVVLSVATLAVTATVTMHSSYSVGKANFRAAAGKGCNFADFVMTEPDPSGGLLTPIAGAQKDSLAGPGTVGVTPDGVPTDITATSTASDSQTSLDAMASLPQETTSGRTATAGVNGSHIKLPYGLDPAVTPILGSYSPDIQTRARIDTAWYRLPAAQKDQDLITLSAAGKFTGDELYLEYSTDGGATVAGKKSFIDIGPDPAWRNLRLSRGDLPKNATAVRIVAVDDDLAINHWLAITPPRMSKLETLQQLVGSKDPVLIDWTSGLAYPCQRPFDHRDGVAEVPKWRIMPDQNLSPVTTDWEGNVGGGPVGWVELLMDETKVPAYLRGDLGQDFGELERLVPYDSTTRPADITTGTEQVWGVDREAPIRQD